MEATFNGKDITGYGIRVKPLAARVTASDVDWGTPTGLDEISNHAMSDEHMKAFIDATTVRPTASKEGE